MLNYICKWLRSVLVAQWKTKIGAMPGPLGSSSVTWLWRIGQNGGSCLARPLPSQVPLQICRRNCPLRTSECIINQLIYNLFTLIHMWILKASVVLWHDMHLISWAAWAGVPATYVRSCGGIGTFSSALKYEHERRSCSFATDRGLRLLTIIT